jgi:DNA-binding GntR family transcriptional regulator
MEYGIPYTDSNGVPLSSSLLVQRGKSLKTQVYEVLKESLLTDGWATGRLSEANIAEKLGVSRTPVREALLQLRREGLVSYTSTGRIQLPHLLPDDVRQIYQLRMLLEDFACSEVSGHLSADQAAALQESLDAMQQGALRGMRNQLLRADREYHVLLAGATGNRYLAEQVGQLFDRITVAGIEATLAPARTEEVLIEHRQALDSLLAGDAVRARTVMRTHLQTSSDLLADSIHNRESSQSQT